MKSSSPPEGKSGLNLFGLLISFRNISTNGLIAILGILGIIGIIANAWSYEVGFFKSFSNLFLLSLAFTMIGLLLGVLFGIPKSVPKANHETTVRANTNLEEVSDWLTKIIIGFGIAELAQVDRQFLIHIADNLSSLVPGLSRMTLLSIVIYFPIYGLLSGWLLTRIYLTEIFARINEKLLEANHDLILLAKQVLDDMKFDASGNVKPLDSTDAYEIISKVKFLEDNRQRIDGNIYNKLGLILLTNRNYQIAAQFFEKSYDITKNPKMKVNLGVVYSLGFTQHEKALEIYQEVLKDHPYFPLALYNAACAQARLEKHDEALTSLERALFMGGDEFKAMAKTDSALLSLSNRDEFKKLVPDYSPQSDHKIG